MSSQNFKELICDCCGEKRVMIPVIDSASPLNREEIRREKGMLVGDGIHICDDCMRAFVPILQLLFFKSPGSVKQILLQLGFDDCFGLYNVDVRGLRERGKAFYTTKDKILQRLGLSSDVGN